MLGRSSSLAGIGPGLGPSGAGTRHLMCSLVLVLLLLPSALATPLRPSFTSCLSSYSPQAPESARLNINDVYASIVSEQEASEEGLQGDGVQVLRLNLFGETQSILEGYDNSTNKLATLFIDTKTASFNVYQSTSWVCNSLFPAELPGPYYPSNTTYCPVSAGPVGLNVSIPLFRSYALTTLRTQIRTVDTSETANTLSCIDVQLTPYDEDGWYYGMFLWLPVALAIGFFVTTWGARFAAGWVVGSGVAEYEQKETALGRGAKLGHVQKEARMRKWGTMIISGLSGERLSVSGGLLRFVTPGLKDILHHVQFCAILGMIAVTWPRFAYPVLSQAGWAMLVGNTTLVLGSDAQSKLVNPYPNSGNYTVPSEFADQVTDPDLPLYMDDTSFNPLLNLYDTAPGIESWAFALGLRPQDLLGTCLAIFMTLVGAVIVISLVLWAAHCLIEYRSPAPKPSTTPTTATGRPSLGASPMPSYGTKDVYDPETRTPSLWDTSAPPALPSQHNVPHPLPHAHSHSSPTGPSHARRIWWRFRPKGEAGAFHASALYGNLLRLILIFHLPITTFSIYQLVLGAPRASIVSRVFAALAFAFISVLIPLGILLKIKRTPSGKLYDATRTLLSLGPMYNVYIEDKQMFRAILLGASLITGIVVGAGQASGLAQAVILVLVELALLIAPAVWYPWDEGASMGAPHTFLGALRTITMVLVMLLSPQLGMTPFTAQWLAYAALLLQAIIFVFFLLMLITKAVEGFIRLFGGVHFDESTHPLDGGLFGAIADLDCLNPKGGKAAERKRRKRGSKQLQRNVSAAGSLTTQMMLDRHSMGVMRPVSESHGHGMGGGSSMMTPTPFLSPPPTGGAGGERSYFPAYTPPLGPPPMERRSSDSRSDEPHMGGNIMDAWRPTHDHPHSPPILQPGYFAAYQSSPYHSDPLQGQGQGQGHGRSQSTPNPYDTFAQPHQAGATGGFAVIRGGRADYNSPYAVKTGTGSDRSLTISPPPSVRVSPISPKPAHNRQHSSSAVIENFDRTSPPQTPAVYRPQPRRQSSGPGPGAGHQLQQRHSLVPPPTLAPIPKRRSLNNLREDSPTRQQEEEREREAERKRQKQKKRRSWFGTSAAAGAEEDDTEESDDEPGPSRPRRRQSRAIPLKEPAPFEPVPRVASGAQHGHEHPGGRSGGILGFLGLRRKTSLDDMAVQAQDENKARKAALAAESGAMLFGVQPAPAEQRSFKVARRDGRPSPLASPAPAPVSTQADQPSSSSFKVKRAGAGGPSARTAPAPSAPAQLDADTPSGGRSFKVVRPNMPHASNSGTGTGASSAASSFVVNRPTPPRSTAVSPPATPPLSRAGTNVSPRTQGKASMFKSPPRGVS